MRIRNPVVCDTGKSSLLEGKVAYISNKPPLVGEHAFPLTRFVGLSAQVTHVYS